MYSPLQKYQSGNRNLDLRSRLKSTWWFLQGSRVSRWRTNLSGKLADKMWLYTSEYIPLQPSWVTRDTAASVPHMMSSCGLWFLTADEEFELVCDVTCVFPLTKSSSNGGLWHHGKHHQTKAEMSVHIKYKVPLWHSWRSLTFFKALYL